MDDENIKTITIDNADDFKRVFSEHKDHIKSINIKVNNANQAIDLMLNKIIDKANLTAHLVKPEDEKGLDVDNKTENEAVFNRTTVVFKDESGNVAGSFSTQLETSQLKFDIQDDGEIAITDAPKVAGINYNDKVPMWLWIDSAIFDDKTKAAFLELPKAEQPRFAADLIDKFYAARPEYNNFARKLIYEDPLKLLDLFKSLTPKDFEALHIPNAQFRFNILQEHIKKAEKAIEKTPIDPENLTTIWPILSIREYFLESEIAEFYYLKGLHLTPKERAQNAGAIMTTGGRLRDISYKDYTGWLDEMPNDAAYISYVGPHYWDNIEIDEGGNLYEGDEAQVRRAVRNQDAKIIKAFEDGTFGNDRPKEHERINKEVMRALLKATVAEHNGIRTIYLPTFAYEMNENYKNDIDEYDDKGELNEKGKQNRAAAEERAKEAEEARKKGEKVYTKEKPSIMQQFYNLDYWVGVLDNNDVMRTAVLVGKNTEAQTIDVVLPYIEKIKQRIREAQELEAERVQRQYLIPAYNDLVYTSIASERNKLAVDLVYTIIDGLLQRGSKTSSDFKENQKDDDQDKPKQTGEKVVYRIKYSTLINDTPLLAMAYKNAKGSKREYDVLNRTFTKAFQLLREKTDIYQYFIDLKIPETPPTKRTLNNTLVITHKGRNTKYKRPQ